MKSLKQTDIELSNFPQQNSQQKYQTLNETLSQPNHNSSTIPTNAQHQRFVTIRKIQPSYIGNVRCYWYNKKTGQPRITIGPTWQFAIPIAISALLAFYCFLMGLYYMHQSHYAYRGVCAVMVFYNMWVYLKTLFGNQGLPKELFVREVMELRNDFENQSNQEGSDQVNTTLESSQDQISQRMENNASTVNGFQYNEVQNQQNLNESMRSGGSFKEISLDNRNSNNSQSYSQAHTDPNMRCTFCNIKSTPGDYHCRICDVCVHDHHHHCVFFSKCIGRGNTDTFFQSITLVIVITVFYTALVVVEQLYAKSSSADYNSSFSQGNSTAGQFQDGGKY
eukprot:403346079